MIDNNQDLDMALNGQTRTISSTAGFVVTNGSVDALRLDGRPVMGDGNREQEDGQQR